ncbi:MAG: hypothetical protein ACRC2T_15885 [Thermoguttaceae bacterium]
MQYFKNNKILTLVTLLGVIACIGYALFRYHTYIVDTDVDERIVKGIDDLKNNITNEYINRAISENAITPQEYHKYKNIARDISEKYNIANLYAIIEVDGHFYIIVSNLVEPFFKEYDPYAEDWLELVETSKDGISRWNVSEDSYGFTRTCISRFTTTEGQQYLVGGDILVSEIAKEHWYFWTKFIPATKDFIILTAVFCTILGIVSVWMLFKKQWVLLMLSWVSLLLAISVSYRLIKEWDATQINTWQNSLREIKRIFAEQTQRVGHEKIRYPLQDNPEAEKNYQDILAAHTSWCQHVDLLLYVYTCRLIGDISEKKLEFIMSCPSDVDADGKIETKVEIGDPPFVPYFDDEDGTVYAWYDAFEQAFYGIESMDTELISPLYGTS